MKANAKQTVNRTVSRSFKQLEPEAELEPDTSSKPFPQDAVSSATKSQGERSPVAELRELTARADRIHALHHHREAAAHHEREAQWNGQWAAWHRAEAKRLEGEA